MWRKKMGREKKDIDDRHKTTFFIPKEVWKEFHFVIIEKYDKTHGYIGASFIEALKLWINREKKKLNREGL